MARIDDVRNEIKELTNKIYKLKGELCKLEAEERSYYIGIEVVGDEDYCDEYYHPLGLITTASAKKWLGNSEHSKEHVFAVDADTYRNFVLWYKINTIRSNLINLRCYTGFSHIASISLAINDLDAEEERIFTSLGLKCRSFQHPGETLNIHDEYDFGDEEI